MGSCEQGNELQKYMKYGEFLDWLRTRQLSKRTLLYGVI
jgi:hypothetical protein